jgi:ATP-dependent helicase HepA
MPAAKKISKRFPAKTTKVAKPAKAVKTAKPKAPAKKAARAGEPGIIPPTPPVLRFKPHVGCKVLALARRDAGFAEITRIEGAKVMLRFRTDVVNFVEAGAPIEHVVHPPLPSQTRVFHSENGLVRYGRVVAPKQTLGPMRSYLVHFPGMTTLTEMREDAFQVRSYLPGDDPAVVLAELAQETPFFFQQRADLLRELLRQNQLSHGLPALISSKVEILQHQAEVADRVLHDPVIRYLLADEVGLGKTIEAGIILRQIRLDAPDARIAVVAPDALVRQWREELDSRFENDDVEVFAHTDFAKDKELLDGEWDVLVIDEAHRVVARQGLPASPITRNALKLAHASKHLLLLSATPVLHHDDDLLALLELLDPENYSIAKLAEFKERTARRVELGRAFLALRSATVPALVKLHAGKLASLLPNDPTVKEFVAALAKPGADAKAIQHELHLHISETYRIHRRMLRTRRRWLAGSHKRFVRDVVESVEMELDEEPHLLLWEALDKWRAAASKRVEKDDKLRTAAAEEYVRLAEAISAEPEKLSTLVKDVAKTTKATDAEVKLLAGLADDKLAWQIAEGRLDLIAESLRRRAAKDGPNGKYVVFCPNARFCADLAKRLHTLFSREGVKVASTSTVGSTAGELFSDFAADRASRVLITDATGEEGFNLQFAKAVIFHDLPWSPMRLEQRLGRLDRIDRTGAIPCIVFVTGEDDAVALDEAWRRVLAEGFGLYTASISDLQHLVDTELPRLRERAFLGGAQALLDAIPALAEAVVKERASIEEQDVIDGMHSLSPESPLSRDLIAADAAAEDFGKAFSAYLQRNLGLEERWDEDTNSFRFRMKRDSNPLIPADKLDSLAAMFAVQFSVHRGVVIEDLTLHFLRPGHSAVDGCRELLAWDDRGRAWAMWRHAPGVKKPTLVFRALVQVSVDLAAVEKALAEFAWDTIRRGSLLRLVRGWFPEFIAEQWLDEHGDAADDKLIETCKPPYHYKMDRNLGKERAAQVREKFGEKEWRKSCEASGKKAVATVTKGDALKSTRDKAQQAATAHFALLRARLKARAQAGIDSAAQAKAETKNLTDLEELVSGILANPVIRLDTLGAYILGEKPWWPEPDWEPALATRPRR